MHAAHPCACEVSRNTGNSGIEVAVRHQPRSITCRCKVRASDQEGKMWSTRISANSGSNTLKTSGFSQSNAKPATNSEQCYVNISSRVTFGSNSAQSYKCDLHPSLSTAFQSQTPGSRSGFCGIIFGPKGIHRTKAERRSIGQVTRMRIRSLEAEEQRRSRCESDPRRRIADSRPYPT
jgi:hypothetical protein